MPSQILLATNNAKKLAELQALVDAADLDVVIVSPKTWGGYPEPDETQDSFAGNALIKARAGVAATGLITIADDSGLCIDVLGGMPGVRSSRWAGPQCDDTANLELVLLQLDDVDENRRTAKFVSTVALVTPEGAEYTWTGEMPGVLEMAPRGEGGFGYDPIFVADDSTAADDGEPRTNAELSAEEKNAISHRGKAMRAMLPTLIELLGSRV